jgi:hypothetical protein
MTVLDLRGCAGSGKSWVMHRLLERFAAEEVSDDRGLVGYDLVTCPQSALVIGPYRGRVCGGCDGIGDAAEIQRRVQWGLERYPVVLLEGLLVSHTYTRYTQIARETPDYRFLFLNTPLEECLRRVTVRRAARGQGPLQRKGMDRIRWDRNTTFGNADCHYIKFQRDGHYTKIVPWRKPLPVVLHEITSGRHACEKVAWSPTPVGYAERTY